MTNNTVNREPTYHIGIIGGMGPQASALLHSIIIEKTGQLDNIRECHEYPLVTHVSIPARDFISNPELRHENVGMLKNAVKALTMTPLNQAVIACNTAHLLIDEVEELGQLPLVSLPQSAVQAAKATGASKIGLIASPTTIRMKLYEPYADELGCTIVTLDQAEQDASAAIIRRIIAGEPVEQPRTSLLKQIEKLKAKGVDAIVLGCTELSVIMHGTKERNVIDALSATADVIVSNMSDHISGADNA